MVLGCDHLLRVHERLGNLRLNGGGKNPSIATAFGNASATAGDRFEF
jgi:hypothetical protein